MIQVLTGCTHFFLVPILISVERQFLASPDFRAGDKGDLTKMSDQVRVWYRWKGYPSGSMENGCWGVASGGIGHQRSFKFITQGHLKKKCDLTKKLWQTLCFVLLERLPVWDRGKWVLGYRPWWNRSPEVI